MKTKVLVVEDDLTIRQVLELSLETEGYEVLTASQGREGLELLSGHSEIGIILLDMMMPVMAGKEFLSIVKNDPKLSKIPVIVLSADSNEDDRAGSVAYMKKPADLNLLLDWIKRFSGGAPHE